MSSPSEWTVPSFLSSIGVDVSDIDTATKALMDAGYKTETYLLAASRDSLKEAKVAFPVIDLIIAHQETARQQNQQQPARDKIYCRTWSTEGNNGTYMLPADSCDDLKQQANQKFNFAADKVTTPRRRKRSRTPAEEEHNKRTAPLHAKAYVADRWVLGAKDKYQKYTCRTDGCKKLIRTYCSCAVGHWLCDRCYIQHKVDLQKEETASTPLD